MKSVVKNAAALPDLFPQKLCYLLIPVAIGLAVLILSKLLTFFGSTLFDDAYMFIRYADNLLAGYGFVWNRGEAAVYGTTSVLYCLLVTVVRAFFSIFDISSSITLIATSFFFSLASILCLAHIRSGLLKAGSFAQSLSLYCWVLLFCTPLLVHSFFGMDTTLSLFANCLLIYAVLRFLLNNEESQTVGLLSIVFCAYLTFAARPDNIIAAILFPVLAMYFFAQNPIKKIFMFLVGLVVLISIDGLVKYLILGDPLPLSFFAKRNGFYEGYVGFHKWNPIGYLLGFLACCVPFLAFTRFKNDVFTYKLSLVFLTPAFITFCYHISMVQIMGHMGRFQLPFLPYLIVFTLICGLRFRGEIVKNLRYWLTSITILISSYIVLVLLNIYVAPLHTDYVTNIEEQQRITPKTSYHFPAQDLGEEGELPLFDPWKLMLEVGEFGKQFPAGTKIAMSEYGYIGAMAPQATILDTIGLHSSDIAHNGFDANKLFSQNPDIIAIPDNVYTKITSLILDNPTFQNDYEYYETAFLGGIAFNKKSPHYDRIQVLFNELWQAIYGDVDKTHYLTKPVD